MLEIVFDSCSIINMKNKTDAISREEFGVNIQGHIVRVYGSLFNLAGSQEKAQEIILKCLSFYNESPTWGSLTKAINYISSIKQ